MIGIWEIIAVLVLIGIVYLIGRKAPQIARKLGGGARELKEGLQEVPNEIKKGYSEDPKKREAKKTKKTKR